MLRTTLASLRAHKGRVALTAVAVVLGVAFMAGTFVLTDTLRYTFDNLFSEATAGLDVTVRSEAAFEEQANDGSGNREPVPESLLDTVLAVPGVAQAEGHVEGYAQLVSPGGEAVTTAGAPTIGFGWGDVDALSPFKLRKGHAPQEPDEIVVDAATADMHGFEVGDRVRVLLQGAAEEFTVAGIVGFGEADNLAGATLTGFQMETAQRVFGRAGQYDAINVIAEEGVEESALASRIEAALPRGFEAVTQEQQAEELSTAIKQGLAFFNTALLVFAGIALFVGAFIIHNTFAMLVAQRSRELALLRAIGASRTQVTASVTAEAFAVGLLASAIGLGLGVVVAVGLRALLDSFGMDLPRSPMQFEPRTVVVSLLAGVGVTVLSALAPARRASMVPPLAAMRDEPPPAPAVIGRRVVAGSIVTGLGLALFAVGTVAGGGLPPVMLGSVAVFFGVAMLSPLIAGPFVRIAGAPFARLGISGQLGQANAGRNRRRTASTASALMIGLALVTFFTVMGSSVKASVTRVIDESFAADFVIGSQFYSGMSTEVAERLAAMPEVGNVSTIRFGQFQFEGSVLGLAGVRPEIDQLLHLTVTDGAFDSLAEGKLVIDEQVAERYDLGVGDRVDLEFSRTSVQNFEVGAVIEQEELLGRWVVSMDVHEANFTDRLDNVLLLDTAAGFTTAELRRALDTLVADYPNLEVRDQAEFKEQQEAQVNQILGLVTVLLLLALVIAVLGIVNTLALSVIERTRELGLLRAVGMSRRQVRQMVRTEAVLVAILGAVLGLVVGLVFAATMVKSLESEGFRVLAIPAPSLAAFVVIAALAGVLAAALPARRASRLKVLEAIASPE